MKIRTCPMCGYEMRAPYDPRVIFEQRHLPRLKASQFCEVLVKINGVKKQICKDCTKVALRAAVRELEEHDKVADTKG